MLDLKALLAKILKYLYTSSIVGEIKTYAGANVPNGWLVCDGSAISRESYAELFNAIGTIWGAGDGSTTFNLPNLKGKVPVGQDTADTSFNTVGKTGGTKNAVVPYHNHTTVSGGSWSFDVTALGARSGSTTLATATSGVSQSASKNTRYKIAANSNTASGGTSMIDRITHGGHAHTVNYAGTSGNATNANLQPYAVVKYIIRAI